jgi:hypothetical protein
MTMLRRRPDVAAPDCVALFVRSLIGAKSYSSFPVPVKLIVTASSNRLAPA